MRLNVSMFCLCVQFGKVLLEIGICKWVIRPLRVDQMDRLLSDSSVALLHSLSNLYLFVYKCVSVCVCVWEDDAYN